MWYDMKLQLYQKTISVHNAAIATHIVAIIADLFFVVRHKLARLHFFVVVFRHDLAVIAAAAAGIAYACIAVASAACISMLHIAMYLHIAYECC
jgi:hypothetical protein